MPVQKGKFETVMRAVGIGMLGLTLLSFIKGIWISLDIDESYAVTLGYRMIRGDRLIRDMWEPHQLSAFLTAFLAAPYVWVRGNTDYLVIYLRVAGSLIHTGIGVILYRQLVKKEGRAFSFCLLLLHLNYLPKWIQTPEFELMHYWCLLGIFLVLHRYYQGEKSGRRGQLLPLGGGILLTGSMLCYPTMILLYPFYCVGMYLLERRYFNARGIRALKSCFSFTLGAFLTGILFLACLFSYMSFGELRRCVSYIFLDTSHGVYTVDEKAVMYLTQIGKQAAAYGRDLLTAAAIVLTICLAGWILSGRGGKAKRFSGRRMLSVVTAVLLVAGLIVQVKAVYGCVFEDQNQFYMQTRYMAVLLPALILGIAYHGKMSLWLWLCVIPGLVSVAAVLLMTNMNTEVTYAKAYIGVLGGCLILRRFIGGMMCGTTWKTGMMCLHYAVIGATLAGLLVCRLVLIRVSGCFPVTIRASLEKMEYGAEKGIYVLADTAEIWNDNYRELETLVNGEDKVLYIGAESLIYANLGWALPATPSSQGTVVFNEMFLYYYEEHPERVPNVIIYDKSYGVNPAYSLSYTFSLQSMELYEWIAANYGEAEVIETSHLIILRR